MRLRALSHACLEGALLLPRACLEGVVEGRIRHCYVLYLIRSRSACSQLS